MTLEEASSRWEQVRENHTVDCVTLGPFVSYQLRKTPRRLIFVLSRYKFAAKLIGENKRILEVGSSEGLGAVILGEFAEKVVGIDIDHQAVDDANKNFASEIIGFVNGDFLGAQVGDFDAVVSFDVIEHIYPEDEDRFFNSVCANLDDYGLCIIGTPNVTAEGYTSGRAKQGHVNMYSWDKLKDTMNKYFHQVFIFSSNDEMVHTGFYPMAHYLIAVGVCKRK